MIYIQGTPLDKWMEEQENKDGVVIINHGTIRTVFGSTIIKKAIKSSEDKDDFRYEDADISIQINGKKYQMAGKVVERKNGVWYVDGRKKDLPNNTQTNNEGVNVPNSSLNTKTKKESSNKDTIIHGPGTTTINIGNRTIIKGGYVNIKRGNKTYTIKGKTIEKVNGQWFADGKPVDWNILGGQYEENNVVSIEINGTVQNLATTSGDVTVNGTVQVARTASGDIKCETATEVHTMSGDVHCKHIEGNVSTMSGDIYE